jgi:DNA replication and repair protein RecF
MQLKKVHLINYKYFDDITIDFDSSVNCVVGKNGIGKTTILDSIYHLAFGKSYFNPISKQNIRHGENFFMIDGSFSNGEKQDNITVSFKRNEKKLIKRNNKAYERLSDHIGKIGLVIISPTDQDLIKEGSEVRRKFMDGVISQNDQNYLSTLINYQKVLSQRNALLKYFAANNTFQSDTLAIYDQQMVNLGDEIFDKRNEFIKEYSPLLADRYKTISGNNEQVTVEYQSQLEKGDFSYLLKDRQQKDLQYQYSSVGIHKDDLILKLNGYPIKKFGSQGQQKSYLIALKFAQYDFMLNQKEEKPILLLDDIFDKLDQERVEQLINMISADKMGQLFISDTDSERTETVVKNNVDQFKLIEL